MRDLGLPHRASILREWKETEGYAIFMALLDERSKVEMQALLRDPATKHDEHAGVIQGLGIAQHLVEQTILDEQRQRPQEVVRG